MKNGLKWYSIDFHSAVKILNVMTAGSLKEVIIIT